MKLIDLLSEPSWLCCCCCCWLLLLLHQTSLQQACTDNLNADHADGENTLTASCLMCSAFKFTSACCWLWLLVYTSPKFSGRGAASAAAG